MRIRLLVFGSLALNLFLVVILLSGRQRKEEVSDRASVAQPVSPRTSGESGSEAARKSDAASAQEQTSESESDRVVDWDALSSVDFKALVARLRDAGYPEETVRDIVVGRVGRSWAAKRLESVAATDLKFWESGVDAQLAALMAERTAALETERERLLDELLGNDWRGGQDPSADSEPFYGGTLAGMHEQKAKFVREIEARFAGLIAAARRDVTSAGKTAAALEVARLKEGKRAALDEVLTGKEFDAYQFCYSDLARSMRRDLAHFNATSNEFAAIFRIREPIERELSLKAPGTEGENSDARKDLERKAADEIRRALGEARYQEYQFNLDPVYRSAREFAAKLGETEKKAMSLYEIGGWARLERRRIEKDPALDDLTRRSQMAETRRRLEQFLYQILSPEARKKSLELGLDFLDSLPR